MTDEKKTHDDPTCESCDDPKCPDCCERLENQILKEAAQQMPYRTEMSEDEMKTVIFKPRFMLCRGDLGKEG